MPKVVGEVAAHDEVDGRSLLDAERHRQDASQREQRPSTKAYAPKRSTSAVSETAGDRRVRIPKTMPATPRSRTAHQLRARTSTSTTMLPGR